MGLNPIERFTRDEKLLKKEQDVSFVPSKRSEIKEIVNIFKISFLNKNSFLYLFHIFHDGNRRGYTLHHNFESRERFQLQVRYHQRAIVTSGMISSASSLPSKSDCDKGYRSSQILIIFL